MKKEDIDKITNSIIVGTGVIVLAVTVFAMSDTFLEGLCTLLAILAAICTFVLAIKGVKHIVKKRQKRPFIGEGSTKKAFKKIKNWNPEVKNATLTINGKFQPQLRRKYEKSLDEILRTNKLGVVIGGNCVYKERMEVDHCEIRLSLQYDDPLFISDFSHYLERALKIPRGSLLEGPRSFSALGRLAGLGLYLDVSDIFGEDVQEKYNCLLSDIGDIFKDKEWLGEIWEAKEGVSYELNEINPHLIGIFCYCDDFDEMRSAIEPIVKESIFSEVYKIIRCA